ncbi:hypothetical protein [Pseudomonas sp.]|uniref:hypothetical protein n=1 Tax=Pseudomonas sp. TaxID=306 RepID=UPI003D6E0A5E
MSNTLGMHVFFLATMFLPFIHARANRALGMNLQDHFTPEVLQLQHPYQSPAGANAVRELQRYFWEMRTPPCI